MSQLRHAEYTYQLRRYIYKVRNELKAGWSENIYHQALARTLQEHGVPVLSKQRRPLLHHGVEVHCFEPDLIAWDTIVLELKALAYQAQFAGEHYAQMIHYLKFLDKDLGLLVNFAPSPVQIKRVVWNEPKLVITEDYDEFKTGLASNDREYLLQIRHCLLAIAQQYGLGYPETMYRKLAAIELVQNNISCVSEIEVPALWNGSLLAYHKTQHLLIGNNYLLHVRSLLEQVTNYDFTQTRTLLAAFGLKYGVIINFGYQQVQIHGIKTK